MSSRASWRARLELCEYDDFGRILDGAAARIYSRVALATGKPRKLSSVRVTLPWVIAAIDQDPASTFLILPHVP